MCLIIYQLLSISFLQPKPKKQLRKKTSDAKFIVYSPDDDESSSGDENDYDNDDVDYEDEEEEDIPSNVSILTHNH